MAYPSRVPSGDKAMRHALLSLNGVFWFNTDSGGRRTEYENRGSIMSGGFEEFLSNVMTLPLAAGSGAVFIAALILLIKIKKMVFKVIFVTLLIITACIVVSYFVASFLFGDSMPIQPPVKL